MGEKSLMTLMMFQLPRVIWNKRLMLCKVLDKIWTTKDNPWLKLAPLETNYKLFSLIHLQRAKLRAKLVKLNVLSTIAAKNLTMLWLNWKMLIVRVENLLLLVQTFKICSKILRDFCQTNLPLVLTRML